MNLLDRLKQQAQVLETSDTYNYILNERYTKRNKETAYKVVGYHSTLNSALKQITNSVLLESDADNFKTLCEKLNGIKRDKDAINYGGVLR